MYVCENTNKTSDKTPDHIRLSWKRFLKQVVVFKNCEKLAYSWKMLQTILQEAQCDEINAETSTICEYRVLGSIIT